MFGHSRSRFYMLPYYCSFDSKCFRSYVSCTLMESKQIIVARYCTTNKLSTKKDINNSNKQMFNIKNMFNNSTTDDSSDQQANSTYIKRVVVFLEEVLHMDDVRRAQEQVINIKNELHETGNKKRLIQRDLDILRRDLNKVYKEFKINWNSCQYLELVKKEVDIYTEIDELQKELAAVDGHEQYLFNAFSVAINDSYEKEKIYTNMIKILGIVGTLLGSFITFVLSVVGFLYNQRKFYTLRKDVQSALTDQVLHKLDKVIEDIKDFQQTVNVKQSMVLTEKPVESWGSYLNRNTRWIYGWALPKK
nr:uncharacterized protein LOC106623454 isoform X1 [Bactrocera oleae]